MVTKPLCKNRLVNNDKTELKQPESTKPIEQATENRFIQMDKTDISEQPKTAVPEKSKAVEPPKPVIEKNPDIVEQAKVNAYKKKKALFFYRQNSTNSGIAANSIKINVIEIVSKLNGLMRFIGIKNSVYLDVRSN